MSAAGAVEQKKKTSLVLSRKEMDDVINCAEDAAPPLLEKMHRALTRPLPGYLLPPPCTSIRLPARDSSKAHGQQTLEWGLSIASSTIAGNLHARLGLRLWHELP